MTCIAPVSHVTGKAIDFSVTLNRQQSTSEKIPYYYYNWPSVTKLTPNYGTDAGGSIVWVYG
jgi:hypothetical protein